MVMIQEEIEEKEQACIRAFQERNKDRRIRFMNAKQRTIGVDKEYLDKQVEEKQHGKQMEERFKNMDALYQKRLVNILEESEMKRKAEKAQANSEVNFTLSEQMRQSKNNAIKKGDPIDIEACSVAAAQYFDGEDAESYKKTKAKQEQLRTWCDEQMTIKEKQRKKEEEENRKYNRFILNQNNFLMKDSKDKIEQKLEFMKSIQADNFELSKKTKEKHEFDKENIRQIEKEVVCKALACPLLGEETTRKDHFKGFIKEQLNDIQQGNEQVIYENNMILQEQKHENKEWAIRQRNIQRHGELENITKQLKVKERNNIQAGILKAQREELAQKQQMMELDKFGAIEDGFFNQFGTSCR